MADDDVLGQASVPIRATLDKLAGDLDKAKQQITGAVGEAGEKAGKTLSQKLADTGKKLQSTGKTLSKRLTLPLVAFGAGAVKAADDVGDAMDSIRVHTGATGKELAGIQTVAQNIAKRVPADLGTVAAAVSSLQTATGATGDTLQDLTSNVLEASRVLGEDGAANATAFGKALNQWGVPAEQGVDVMKALYAGSQKYGQSISSQIGNLNAYGAILQNAGFSMQDSVALFGQMEKAGLSVSRLMPGLNMAFRKWAQANKDPQKELSKTIDAVKNAKSSTEALKIATDAFGAQGAQRLVTAVRESGVSFSDLSSQLDTTGVDILDVGDNTRTMGEQMSVLKNNAELALAPLGNKLLPVVTKAIQKVVPWIQRAVGWFEHLGGGGQTAVLLVVGALAAVGPVLSIVGKGMQLVTGVVKAFTVAQRALNVVMAANPMFLVIAALALLVAGLVIAYQKSETFREIVQAVWDAIKTAVTTAINAVKDVILKVTGFIADHWKAFVMGLAAVLLGPLGLIVAYVATHLEQVKRVIATVTGAIRKAWDAVWGAIKAALQAVWDAIKAYVELQINAVRKVIETVTGAISAAWSKVWGGIKAAAEAIWSGIRSLIDREINGIKRIISAVMDTVKSIIGGAVDWIKDRFNGLVDFVTGLPDRFMRGLSTIGDGLRRIFKDAFNGVARIWNNSVGSLSFKVPGWVPGVGGKGFSMPRIPEMADGGIVKATPGGVLALLGEGRHDEAVVPLDGRIGSTYNVTLQAAPTVPTEQQLLRTLRVVDLLYGAA